MKSLQFHQKRAVKLLHDYSHAKKQVKEEKIALVDSEEELVATEKTQQILQHLAQQIQESAHQKISVIISRCLQTIWPDHGYSFAFCFERKRGRTEAVPTFLRDGKILKNPMRTIGGSCCQVASFAARVAKVVMTRPAPRRLMISDEPFSGLDRVRTRKVRGLLESLAQELSLQIIMVTHNSRLRIGNVISLGEDN